jgi:uncharacterized membrane protein
MSDAPEQIEIPDTAPEAPEQESPKPEAEQPKEDDELPEAVKEKLRKLNSEAKNLRTKLKEQEPLVAAAQEAERAKMSELDRVNADMDALKAQLAQRDTELLQARYQIPDDYIEFIGAGTFEEKETRAAKVGQMVQKDQQERPPTERPVESLKPGASPSTPPVEDHSYPANWGFQPQRQT